MFFGQGYIHASMRLWQMEFQRRIASGTLSEVVGESAKSIDVMIRTFDVPNASRDIEKRLVDFAVLNSLQSYIDGVNAYLDENPSLPLEFKLLGYQPKKWEIKDIIGWSIMMSYDLGNYCN